MTEQEIPGNTETERTRRGRKPYPTITFKEALILPKAILEHGTGDKLRRLTLFDKIQRKPESGPSRQIISTAARYGLITGNAAADYLYITDDAKKLLDDKIDEKTKKLTQFKLSIDQIDIFQKIYERLKNKKIPALDILSDEFIQLNVPKADARYASQVFTDNIRDLGLIQETSGNERIIALDHLLETIPQTTEIPAMDDKNTSIFKLGGEPPKQEPLSKAETPVTQPSVHIDIQIHIDSTASPTQIESIFANMAKYLYHQKTP